MAPLSQLDPDYFREKFGSLWREIEQRGIRLAAIEAGNEINWAAFNGDLSGNASWTTNGKAQSETTAEKVRNVSPIKINEFRVSSPGNATNSFIELYNAGARDADGADRLRRKPPARQYGCVLDRRDHQALDRRSRAVLETRRQRQRVGFRTTRR